ncbi:M48 family metallopeptidase [Kordiimonas sp. SCSIO 12610]|nr:M48 family metallopeptidase [Kordiimonas sp. SCSIO 12610]
MDTKSGLPVVTIPDGAKQTQVKEFLTNHIDWITDQTNIFKNSSLQTGDVICFEGQEHRLEYSNTPPRKVWFANDNQDRTIIVGGPIDQAGKRLERWLRKTASEKLTCASSYYAETLGVNYSRISIGDMKTRWGSCSSKGTLRFNWRLIMAPPDILEYVAAHEVCHLLEMNHSDRFWAHVQSCRPEYQKERAWLRSSGQSLMTIRL